jgi:hypothetical protein
MCVYLRICASICLLGDTTGVLFNQLLAAQHAAYTRLQLLSTDSPTPTSVGTDASVTPLDDETTTNPRTRSRTSSSAHWAELHALRSAAVSHFVQELSNLAMGKSYQERQLFVRLAEVMWIGDCVATAEAAPAAGTSNAAPSTESVTPMASAVADQRAFQTHVLPLLLTLASDKVANVRLAVARTLKAVITSKRAWSAGVVLRSCLRSVMTSFFLFSFCLNCFVSVSFVID